jgi:tetratricopeptide (TPR) repeat protein
VCALLAVWLSLADYTDPDFRGPVSVYVCLLCLFAIVSGLIIWRKLIGYQRSICVGSLVVSALLLLQGIYVVARYFSEGPSHVAEMLKVRRSAWDAEAHQEFAEAERIYKSMIEKERSGWYKQTGANLYLGEVLEKQGKNQEAESHYMAAIEQQQTQHDNSISVTLEELANLYFKEKRYKESDIQFKRALALYRQGRGEQSDYLRCLQRYEALLRLAGSSEQLEAVTRESAAVSKSRSP